MSADTTVVKITNSSVTQSWVWLIDNIPHSRWAITLGTASFYFIDRDDAVWFQLANGGEIFENVTV